MSKKKIEQKDLDTISGGTVNSKMIIGEDKTVPIPEDLLKDSNGIVIEGLPPVSKG